MDKYEKLRKLAKEVEATLPWHNHEGDWVTRDHQDIEGLGERGQPADEYALTACNAVPGLLEENERLRKALKILRDRCYCYCYLPRPDDKHDPFCATEIAREALERK